MRGQTSAGRRFSLQGNVLHRLESPSRLPGPPQDPQEEEASSLPPPHKEGRSAAARPTVAGRTSQRHSQLAVDDLRRELERKLENQEKEIAFLRMERGLPSAVPEDPSPFTKEILGAPLPTRIQIPAVKPYDGLGDPADHFHNFEALMTLQGASDAMKCRAFATTLIEGAQS